MRQPTTSHGHFFSQKEGSGADFLHEDIWQLDPQQGSAIQGVSLGHTQELNDNLHLHLDLPNTMVHVPTVRPGDYIAWHCDTIHAVDKVHEGSTDSSLERDVHPHLSLDRKECGIPYSTTRSLRSW